MDCSWTSCASRCTSAETCGSRKHSFLILVSFSDETCTAGLCALCHRSERWQIPIHSRYSRICDCEYLYILQQKHGVIHFILSSPLRFPTHELSSSNSSKLRSMRKLRVLTASRVSTSSQNLGKSCLPSRSPWRQWLYRRSVP